MTASRILLIAIQQQKKPNENIRVPLAQRTNEKMIFISIGKKGDGKKNCTTVGTIKITTGYG